MAQHDYLKKQTDQLGRVLGKILSDLLGLKEKGMIHDGIEATSQAFKSNLDIDIEELITLPTEDFVHVLQTEKGFHNVNLEILADILLVIANANQSEDGQREQLHEKCLTIYQYLEDVETIHSFDRYLKIEHIKKLL